MNMRETVLSFYVHFIFCNRNQTFRWARWKISITRLYPCEVIVSNLSESKWPCLLATVGQMD